MWLSVWGNMPGCDGRSVGTIRDGRDDRNGGSNGNGRNDWRSGNWTVVSSNKLAVQKSFQYDMLEIYNVSSMPHGY